ncbi:MAG: SUMF1/EgtB/PvdO family nonheme iron enzyme, partial [Candidatus Sumerlaeota bacterium]|nr:SUMF1/EgtB/PvdO family nonheme iron enzyme [Candidatus Sumerlaeota bacterium]
KPNAWGLYDMHGNVWEWCQDAYQYSYNGASADGAARESADASRVLRGGSWYDFAGNCGAADRGSMYPGLATYSNGFRVCGVGVSR